MKRARSPVWIPARAEARFPDPRNYDAHGLIAGGGDLSSARLLEAYRTGIFPWYDEPPILWWSPDPRAIVTPASLHVSRSLARTMKAGRFTVTCNRAPLEVMQGCADRPEGTWLNEEMKQAYMRLFELGHLVSFEVWAETTERDNDTTDGRELAGGLYGVLVDGLFAAESKFHNRTDASKVALVCAVRSLFARGVQLFDVQFRTDHLASLGIFEISREAYLARLEMVRQSSSNAPSSSIDDLLVEVLQNAANCGAAAGPLRPGPGT